MKTATQITEKQQRAVEAAKGAGREGVTIALSPSE
jgi:hypothetical protein